MNHNSLPHQWLTFSLVFLLVQFNKSRKLLSDFNITLVFVFERFNITVVVLRILISYYSCTSIGTRTVHGIDLSF